MLGIGMFISHPHLRSIINTELYSIGGIELVKSEKKFA
jgi:hypothetical protein